jgi:ribonuclease P protein component
MVVVLRRPGCEPRALLVTSRRVGKAVVRNRVRRRLREVFRALSPRLTVPGDVAIVAHPGSGEVGYWVLFEEIAGLLAGARLLRAEAVV